MKKERSPYNVSQNDILSKTHHMTQDKNFNSSFSEMNKTQSLKKRIDNKRTINDSLSIGRASPKDGENFVMEPESNKRN